MIEFLSMKGLKFTMIRISAFEMWCWRRFLRIPWTARKRKKFVLDAVGIPLSLEGRVTLVKLRHYGHFIRKDDSLENDIMLGMTEVERRRPQRKWRDTVEKDWQLELSAANVLCRDRAGWRRHGRAVPRGGRGPDGL